MTKYKGLEDIGFKRVSAQLCRWNEDIKAVPGPSIKFDTAHIMIIDYSPINTNQRPLDEVHAHPNGGDSQLLVLFRGEPVIIDI